MKRKLFILVLFNLILTVTLLSQTIKVDDYGAVGDGVTDDRATIQSALDVLKSNGGELQFTSGKTYIIKSGLNLSYYSASRNYLITTTGNEKATIKIADGTSITYGHWGMSISNSRNITISNLHMDGNRDTRNPTVQVAGTYLIQIINRCDGLRLNDLILENSVIDNIIITASNQTDSTTFLSDFEMHNCVLRNGWRNNMSIIRGKNFKIIDCEFSDVQGLGDPEAGIDFEPDRTVNGSDLGYHDILIEGCIFKNNKKFGIVLTEHDEDTKYEGRVTIRNNYFENNGIYVLSSNNIITGNVFRKVDHKPIANIDGTKITDGIIVFSPWYWVKVRPSNNIITENYFRDNDELPAGQHLIGVDGNGINNVISSNYEYNNKITGFVGVDNTSKDAQTIENNKSLTKTEVKMYDERYKKLLGYASDKQNGIVGQWDFDDTTNITVATVGKPLELVGTAIVVEGPEDGNTAVSIGVGNYFKAITGIDPNGGGTKVNTYTLSIDFKVDAFVGYVSLIQTDPLNSSGNDGDLFLNRPGIVGAGGIGYSNKIIDEETWYRMVVVRNVHKADSVTTDIYLNGELAYSGNPVSIDGRLGLDSTILLFADNDGEDNLINVAKVALYNYALTNQEISDLGSVIVGIDKKEVTLPTIFSLEQNYPNPFNPTTKINFTLPKTSDVKLSVYNIIGEKVATLINSNLVAGNHSVSFNSSDLTSGIYMYRITVGEFVSVKKMILLK